MYCMTFSFFIFLSSQNSKTHIITCAKLCLSWVLAIWLSAKVSHSQKQNNAFKYNQLVTLFERLSIVGFASPRFLFYACEAVQGGFLQRARLSNAQENKCVTQHNHLGMKLMS